MLDKLPKELNLEIMRLVSDDRENVEKLNALARTNKAFNILVKENFWKNDMVYQENERFNHFQNGIQKLLEDYAVAWEKDPWRSKRFWNDKDRGNHVRGFKAQIARRRGRYGEDEVTYLKRLFIQIAEEMDYAKNKRAKRYAKTLEEVLEKVIDQAGVAFTQSFINSLRLETKFIRAAHPYNDNDKFYFVRSDRKEDRYNYHNRNEGRDIKEYDTEGTFGISLFTQTIIAVDMTLTRFVDKVRSLLEKRQENNNSLRVA